jgi:hypothetical protein
MFTIFVNVTLRMPILKHQDYFLFILFEGGGDSAHLTISNPNLMLNTADAENPTKKLFASIANHRII